MIINVPPIQSPVHAEERRIRGIDIAQDVRGRADCAQNTSETEWMSFRKTIRQGTT